MAYSEGGDRKLAYDESEILHILRAEREGSVGFDYDEALNGDRERALNYYKGDMPDMPVLENRSSVVSTDVADGVETALPDLIDVFLSGDDGMTFRAFGAEDEDRARQETDYVRYVIFQQNQGFREFYAAFKDALLSKVGVFKFYWDGTPEWQEYEAEVDELQLAELEQMGVEIVSIEPAGDGIFRVTARKMVSNGMVRVEAIPPEDFTVADDTVHLADTAYCAYRRRCRKQDLLADGYDEDKVAQLQADDTTAAEVVEQARDLAGEHSEHQFATAAVDDLQQVEVVEHYIRMDLEGAGRPQIWRIVTGNNESVLLDMEKRSRIEFAAVTPYPQTHRFYGQSLADKLVEIQRWKTSLIRNFNDSIYFALNKRTEVDLSGCTADTIPALLDNTPGRPVPVKRAGTINPIGHDGALGGELLAAIEFANTVSEQRTGVVRNAQGLNPDTLHDTAKGAQILIGAAQKRIRMMARLFAEGGVRDLYLGVHDLLRSNATMRDTIRLRNGWVEVDPSAWNRRKDMVIEIGIGSGGREEKLVKFNLFADRLAQLLEAKEMVGAELVSAKNLYDFAEAYGDALDIKSPERFLTDPSQQPPQQEGPPPEVQAKMAELQLRQEEAKAGIMLDRQKAQAQAELEQQKAAARLQAEREKAALDAQIARERHELEIQLAREKAAAEVELARERMQSEAQLAREKAALEAQISAYKTDMEVQMSDYRPGGDLDK